MPKLHKKHCKNFIKKKNTGKTCTLKKLVMLMVTYIVGLVGVSSTKDMSCLSLTIFGL